MIDARERFERAPPVQIVCGRWWAHGPDCWAFGLLWAKITEPMEGCSYYARRWLLRVNFRFDAWIDRN